MLSANVTKISFPPHTIEGLWVDANSVGKGEDAKFAIAVSQASEMFSLDKTVATRTFKALLGADFSLVKYRTGLNSSPVNILTLTQFETVAFELPLKGNPHAIAFCKACIGLSMHQIFCDSFGIRCEENERKAYLLARYAGIESRNEWTDAIADWLVETNASDSVARSIYASVSGSLNVALTGHRASHWNTVLKLGKGSKLRDRWNPKHLNTIDKIESAAAAQLKKGHKPEDALARAIDFLNASVNSQPFIS